MKRLYEHKQRLGLSVREPRRPEPEPGPSGPPEAPPMFDVQVRTRVLLGCDGCKALFPTAVEVDRAPDVIEAAELRTDLVRRAVGAGWAIAASAPGGPVVAACPACRGSAGPPSSPN